MLAFVIVAVFVAGLMVGRTPEYLGKKIEAYEMKMASLMLLIPILLVKVGTAIAVVAAGGSCADLEHRRSARLQRSAVCLLVCKQQQRQRLCRAGREHALLQHRAGYLHVLRTLLAGRPRTGDRGITGRKKKVPASAGTLPTHTPLFIAWLIGVIMIVGALSFIPALALGPIVEHLMVFAALKSSVKAAECSTCD